MNLPNHGLWYLPDQGWSRFTRGWIFDWDQRISLYSEEPPWQFQLKSWGASGNIAPTYSIQLVSLNKETSWMLQLWGFCMFLTWNIHQDREKDALILDSTATPKVWSSRIWFALGLMHQFLLRAHWQHGIIWAQLQAIVACCGPIDPWLECLTILKLEKVTFQQDAALIVEAVEAAQSLTSKSNHQGSCEIRQHRVGSRAALRCILHHLGRWKKWWLHGNRERSDGQTITHPYKPRHLASLFLKSWQRARCPEVDTGLTLCLIEISCRFFFVCKAPIYLSRK